MFLIPERRLSRMELKIADLAIRVTALESRLENLTGSIEPMKPTPMNYGKEPLKYATF